MHRTTRNLAALGALIAATSLGGEGAARAEFDPGTGKYMPYTLTSAQSSSTAYVDATNAAGYSTSVDSQDYVIDGSSEYWNVPSDLLTTLQDASTWFDSITLTPGTASDYPASGPLPDFSAVTAAETTNPVSSLTWTAGSDAPSGAFSNGSIAVGFLHLGISDGAWTGYIDWWYLGASAPTGPIVSSSSATTLHFNAASAPPSGQYWWHAEASVSSVYLP